MALGINTNMMAMNAARNLNTAYGKLAKSVNRLSSGQRVNGAADDAAGLAIRELMRAEVKALNQGVRNANDSISLIQTADGALGIIDEKLIRMKELAEQGATGTYTEDQRAMISSEYQAMASEITRIATGTDFNGLKVLDGTMSAMTVHFGPTNVENVDNYVISIGEATASALGVAEGFATQGAAQSALDKVDAAIKSKDNIRANLGALQNRLENTASVLTIQSENLSAAESRITDADVSTEMTEFVRNQIVTQSAVSMLAQANSLPKMALSLIQG